VIVTKVRPPALRRGAVSRLSLVSGLCREQAAVVSLVAPAGYGKTTVLTQWAGAESRPVGWLSVDARDNDPAILLKHLVAVVDSLPLDRRLPASLGKAREAASGSTADHLARALESCSEPFLLVLDDIDVLHSRESRNLLSMLITRSPAGSTVAWAARTAPRFPTAALGKRGGLREIGVEELALSKREAQLLLQRADADLDKQETADVIELCEGWPAALYLASLSLHDGTTALRPSRLEENDRYLADYIRSEYLADLRPRELRLLRRASILGRLSGSLCNAVVQDHDSARELGKLARAHGVLVPLAGTHGWYRFHRLIQEHLRRELVLEEPHVIPTLHRRASAWFERNGDPESALDHAHVAGEPDRIAAIVITTAIPAYCRGRAEDLERRLARFDEAANLERYPAVALHGSWVHARRGRVADAERWLEVAERGARRRGQEAAALRPRTAVIRAALCRHGARRMLADAGSALVALPPSSQWYPAALHMRGSAALLLGADDEADSLLTEAARAAEVQGCTDTGMIAVSQLSLLARARSDLDRADLLSAQARQIALQGELEAYPTFAIALATSALTALCHGRWAEGRELVAASEPLRPSLTEALPWLAVSTRLELARCYLTLRDAKATRALMAEIDAILEVRPRLGVLAERASDLRREAGALAVPVEAAPAGLTGAELRLLPLLATHLSFREIADQLQVSRNTVKTQAISIYRKLGVSGRSEAMAAAAGRSSSGAA
jgi:LuxR family transcriptional regulator, maltose regulon positive regulatory protein